LSSPAAADLSRDAHVTLLEAEDSPGDHASGRSVASPEVNAAGARADAIAQMAGLRPLGIVPHRRAVTRVPAPEGQMSADGRCCRACGKAGMRNPMRVAY
jgi:glycine/D-amino acid oxidase-like deaminating enzyme